MGCIMGPVFRQVSLPRRAYRDPCAASHRARLHFHGTPPFARPAVRDGIRRREALRHRVLSFGRAGERTTGAPRIPAVSRAAPIRSLLPQRSVASKWNGKELFWYTAINDARVAACPCKRIAMAAGRRPTVPGAGAIAAIVTKADVSANRRCPWRTCGVPSPGSCAGKACRGPLSFSSHGVLRVWSVGARCDSAKFRGLPCLMAVAPALGGGGLVPRLRFSGMMPSGHGRPL